VKEPTETSWHIFLDLVNTAPNQLAKFIESSELDMTSGFSAKELLPSAKFVWDTIRFLLNKMTHGGVEKGTANENDTTIRGYQRIHLANLEAFGGPQWQQKLPYYIRRDFSGVSETARQAAKAFVEFCHMPKDNRPHFVRCRWCQKYFVGGEDDNDLCSDKCKAAFIK